MNFLHFFFGVLITPLPSISEQERKNFFLSSIPRFFFHFSQIPLRAVFFFFPIWYFSEKDGKENAWNGCVKRAPQPPKKNPVMIKEGVCLFFFSPFFSFLFLPSFFFTTRELGYLTHPLSLTSTHFPFPFHIPKTRPEASHIPPYGCVEREKKKNYTKDKLLLLPSLLPP